MLENGVQSTDVSACSFHRAFYHLYCVKSLRRTNMHETYLNLDIFHLYILRPTAGFSVERLISFLVFGLHAALQLWRDDGEKKHTPTVPQYFLTEICIRMQENISTYPICTSRELRILAHSASAAELRSLSLPTEFIIRFFVLLLLHLSQFLAQSDPSGRSTRWVC